MLLKILNKAYIPPNISIGQLDRLVNNITTNNYISFSNDQIPHGGKENYKAFHITIYCKGTTLPKVLINNKSTLNVMPMSYLNKLPINASHIQSSHTIM